MGSKITGFDELTKSLKKLEKNIGKASGKHNVSFDELFNKQFMTKNTKFGSIDEMFDNSGFKVESNADFEAIPVLEFDSFVRQNTKFKNWHEMKALAGSEYGAKLVGKAFDDAF